ncbi:alpha/beta hydrolase family protein [Chitinophaga silvisoli]|uniref:Alpha/beta fold hydrolase n=1 Tax=Chitinophaga silvisoli TaxID=2291814 RepID=A0A3E1NT43_9BACT|nr:alpha/beta fold hydrolase [Chitinophaga silvisoli]RFM31083.1 alpha/beta fold hydrolase [Chitinophaga silvisoli]
MANEDYSTQRLSQRYRFSDPNMDLFFLGALGWGPAGGLSAGEAFYVAARIKDGDADSWADAFERQGEILHAQAEKWQQRGLVRAAGEARLKAFACYRSAWQFVAPGERFLGLFRNSQGLFDQAMGELGLTAIGFSVPYGGGVLPGHYYPASDPAAPTVLVIGGADTCHEDRFLSQGRYYLERGYAVALVDLPGQGIVQEQGLYWEAAVEQPIGAVIDVLTARFGVGKIALLGMSLGGYFACRAAAYEPRLAAVMATPALTCPYELFSGVAKQMKDTTVQSEAALRNHQVLMWKAGATDLEELGKRWEGVAVDPALVQVPFLSVLGMQEGSIWKKQTEEWHAAIPSAKKSLLKLDAETGADAHCQGSNPLRLAQEVDGWLREIL